MKIYADIFWQFFKLGLVSFGGPAAHIGYFQRHFVEKLKWLSQSDYGQLVAMGQILPGPGSSQTGFAVGLRRGGLPGALAAFVGFTLPSFLLMYLLVSAQQTFSDSRWVYDLINGLKLLAVVVVADAILTMGRNFTASVKTAGIAVFTCIMLLLLPSSITQIACIAVAALLGSFLLRDNNKIDIKNQQTNSDLLPRKKTFSANIYLISFLLIFVITFPGVLVFAGIESTLFEQGSLFYQSGSLVFGGGHVVLPLLQQGLGDSVTQEQFLSGYAYAQAVPGPMFTMATYLGAVTNPDAPFTGALIATLAIFLPGFLLVLALDKSWQRWMSKPSISSAVAGINASVVGLLLAALYQPVFVSSVTDERTFAAVVVGFFLLRFAKCPIVILVIGFAIIGLVMT